jgi:hypothetical protein
MPEVNGYNSDSTFVRMLGDQPLLSYDQQAAAAKFFAYIEPGNPIGQLNKADRVFLWALLVVYSRLAKSKQEGTLPSEPLENIAKLLSKVARLATKLESEVFEGPMSEILLSYTGSFRDLPSRMGELSTQLEKAIGA